MQVKSQTNQQEFDIYAEQGKDGVFSRMFYAFHTGTVSSEDAAITILDSLKLARMSLNAGLADWIIRKAE